MLPGLGDLERNINKTRTAEKVSSEVTRRCVIETRANQGKWRQPE
jgi:hypothetical protein